MKYILTFTFFLAVISGCGDARPIPVSGKYQKLPFHFTTRESTDAAWNRLLDFLQQNHIAIDHTDRSSGIITTKKISFLHDYTWENKDHRLVDPSAYIVCARLRAPLTMSSTLDLEDVTGQWQFWIKEDSGGLSVDISLTNALAYSGGMELSQWAKKNARRPESDQLVQSTGVFEQKVQAALRQS
ncbi:MAG: hypothetical protein Q8941_13650 [Bacteroidota bacterium]|nr:hypothetical protein [Bacteroidota bacterium]